MFRLTAAFSLSLLIAAAAHADNGPLPPGFDKIKTVVVVFAENRSFVHLLPDHPGAFGIAEAPEKSVIPRDRDGAVLPFYFHLCGSRTAGRSCKAPRRQPLCPLNRDALNSRFRAK